MFSEIEADDPRLMSFCKVVKTGPAGSTGNRAYVRSEWLLKPGRKPEKSA